MKMRNSRSINRSKGFRKVETLEDRRLMAAHIVGSPTAYATIQAAVNAATAGAVINVDAGTYAELVTVSKTLTIRGAQAGVDARTNARQAGTGESLLTGTSGSSSFYITASDVTIDGFTVQGNTSTLKYGAGIVMAPNIHGTQILDNILQNNVSGLYLSNNSTTDPAIIRYNAFKTNNNAGANGGRGIYTDESVFGSKLTNVTIDSNFFYKNGGGSGTTGLEAAIAVEPNLVGMSTNIRVTNNSMDYNGKAVLFFHTSGITITGNYITNAQDKYSGTLRFEGDDANVTIQNNTIYDNTGPAVAVDSKGVPGDDSGFVVTNNNFYNNSTGWGSKISVIVNDDNYNGVFDARNNYWGNASGPSGNGKGTGDGAWGNGHVVSGSQWATAAGGNLLFSPWNTAPVGSLDTPYWGLAASAGSVIQAEDFNHGGKNNAYATTGSNTPGRYRPNESIAIEASTDTGGGYDVTTTKAGQWMDYSVNLAVGGTYSALFRVANSQTLGGTFHLNLDGVNVTGAITAPATGGAQTWQTITIAGITTTSGPHILRLMMDSNGSSGTVANFNWLELINTAAVLPPTAPSNLTAIGTSTTQIGLSWVNTAGAAVSGFELDRSSDGLNFSLLANLGATVSTYVDSGLLSSTTFSYRVEAISAGGISTGSNIATASTQAIPTIPVNLSALPWVTATAGWNTVQKNLSIKGNALTLRGATYTSGLGTHAVSQIVYNLAGQYIGFASDAGIDDESAGHGSVDFQVIGDGRILFDSGIVSGASPVVHINVNVQGVQQLTLVATNAVAGSIDFDHADWAGAQLMAPSNVPPTAPVNLVATAISSSQINLNWSNTAGNATAIELDRSTDGVIFAPVIANLPPTTTTYSDAGLTALQTYTYRLIASNTYGVSPVSGIATAATFSATAVTTYLSSLTPTSAVIGWGTVQNNLSNKGNLITLRGTVYQQGVGTHADSTITYNLAGQYTQFVSDVGIDDEVTGQGSVTFQVIADGVIVYASDTITGASDIGHINISVAGVQQLQLVVTSTTPGVIDYDHADWAGARLLA